MVDMEALPAEISTLSSSTYDRERQHQAPSMRRLLENSLFQVSGKEESVGPFGSNGS